MEDKRRSLIALNGVNFFLAQIAAVVIPFLNVYLLQQNWRYDQIGIAMAAAGMGSLLFQIPAGLTCDHLGRPRTLLCWSAFVLGICYLLIPMLSHHVALVMAVLFFSGIPGTFFAPLLGSLATALVGRQGLDSLLGQNQSWSHAGGMASGFLALVVVRFAGIEALFYAASAMSLLATACCLTIRKRDLQPAETATPLMGLATAKSFVQKSKMLLTDRDVRTLLLVVLLFQIANGPMGSLVTLYMKHLGSSDARIAWIVLVAQPIMIPVAWWAGRYGPRLGRKRIFSLAFVLLPVRLILYTMAQTPNQVLAITALDGVIAGIFGVLLVLICSDLTYEKKTFNSLMGMVHTAPAAGAVIGLALQGFLIQSFGFAATFLCFASVAVLAALVVTYQLPDTSSARK